MNLIVRCRLALGQRDFYKHSQPMSFFHHAGRTPAVVRNPCIAAAVRAGFCFALGFCAVKRAEHRKQEREQGPHV